MTTAIAPTAPLNRIELLDTLRGLAIFGILMVNMPLFFKPVSSMLLGFTHHDTNINLIADLFIKFFFEGKFYVLFSMLFGYGFYIFLNRQAEYGKSLVPLFRIRLLILLLFGITHVLLLWAGDILTFYALLGLLLPAFMKVSDRGLIRWSIWLALVPSILALFSSSIFGLASLHPESRDAVAASMQASADGMKLLVENSSKAYTTGSFSEIVTARINEFTGLLPGIIFFYPVVLAMFLIGFWAARKNVIGNFMAHLKLFKRLLLIGLTVGILCNVVYVYSYTRASVSEPGIWSVLYNFTHLLGGVMVSLAYVSICVLLTARNELSGISRLLAPVGRMALTNYLFHSIICTTLFLPYGFGLFGKIEMWQGILITIIIFIIQVPFSILWLKRFNYGPFEWLWRSLTYRHLQPFRKS